MIIATHHDDAELSMGGTIITLATKKHNVYLLNLTNGEPTPRGSVETRLKEARNADKILKVKKRIILDFPNRYLQDRIEYREKTAGYIREFRPNILFVPYYQDAHPDHISASSISVAARFYAKLTKSNIKGEPFYPWKMIFYFSIHMKLNIIPSFVLPVSKEVFARKLSAINVYKSQFSYRANKKIPEYVESVGKYFGASINTDYGEPFYTPEILGIKDLSCLV